MSPPKRMKTENADLPSPKLMKTENTDLSTRIKQISFPYKEREDWRVKVPTLKERQKYALMEGHLTDVTFSVGPEKKLFHAHKIILSLASPVFEAMFYGSLKETGEVIDITDIFPIGFQFLLEFIYTDELNVKSESEAFSAWIAADKYCLVNMRDQCFKYLFQCSITSNNVWTVLENSLFLDSLSLIHRCHSFLKKGISEAIQAPGFLDVGTDTIKNILSIPSLYIKEITLLRSIIHWGKEKIKNGTEESLEELIKPFLPHVHFGCMSQSEFISLIDDHQNLISDRDSLQILKYMNNDKLHSLPEWCSHNVFSRKICENDRQKSLKSAAKHMRSYVVKPQESNVSRDSYSNQSNHDDLSNDDLNERDYNDATSSDSSVSSHVASSSSDSSSESEDDYSRAVPIRNVMSSDDWSDSSL